MSDIKTESVWENYSCPTPSTYQARVTRVWQSKKEDMVTYRYLGFREEYHCRAEHFLSIFQPAGIGISHE